MTTDELKVPWHRVALVMTLVAIASLVTLVVVGAVRKVDTLSTVALALAVLAFGAELAIAIAQSQASVEQRARVEEIRAETHEALAAIRATTGGVLTTVQNQFETVLQHALGEAIPEAVGESTAQGTTFDADIFEQRLLEKLTYRLDDAVRDLQLPIPKPRLSSIGPTGADSLDLKAGEHVWHTRWGPGLIVQIDHGRDGPEATIDFESVGMKRLAVPWAPLRRYDPDAGGDEKAP